MSQECDPMWLSKAKAVIGYSNYNVCVCWAWGLYTHNPPVLCETKTSPVVLCPVQGPVLGKAQGQPRSRCRRTGRGLRTMASRPGARVHCVYFLQASEGSS